MNEHPEYLLTLVKDRYTDAFYKPVNMDTCSKLRADKRDICHPEGELPTCAINMSITQLTELYKKHRACHAFRMAENQSFCFNKTDSGHQKAESFQKQQIDLCYQFIKQKTSSSTPKSEPIFIPKPTPTPNSQPIFIPKPTPTPNSQPIFIPKPTPTQVNEPTPVNEPTQVKDTQPTIFTLKRIPWFYIVSFMIIFILLFLFLFYVV
jgi:hypothetical protein